MNDEQDVKELLGRAFGEEPPLAIDRDEVFHVGRKRLRRRHALAAGGVAAAVVVASAGAATLTGAFDAPLPPAATSTAPGPYPGLDLPLPTATVPDAQARALTELIEGSGVMRAAQGKDPVAFRDGYVYEGDVVLADGTGSLRITIRHEPGAVLDCVDVESFQRCEITSSGRLRLLQARSHDAAGVRTNLVSAVLHNGMKATAVASNRTVDGDAPSSPRPVMDMPALALLMAKLDAG